MTEPFTKRDLQALIDETDRRMENLNNQPLPPKTMEEAESNRADLRKLAATKSELLERMKVAPD
jgi:hypothetical protein